MIRLTFKLGVAFGAAMLFSNCKTTDPPAGQASMALAIATGCGVTPEEGPAAVHWDRDACAHCNMVIDDVNKDARFAPKVDAAVSFETQSIICVPLKIKNKVIGVIELINEIMEDLEDAGEDFDREIQVGMMVEVPATVIVLDRFIKEVEPNDYTMPILLKRYLKLNGRIIGFNLDPKFNDALDGMLVLDLYDVPMDTIASLSKEINDDSILERFLAGKGEV